MTQIPPLTPVEGSSNLTHTAYDPATQTLYARFQHGGPVYRYTAGEGQEPITQALYDEWMAAPSKGKLLPRAHQRPVRAHQARRAMSPIPSGKMWPPERRQAVRAELDNVAAQIADALKARKVLVIALFEDGQHDGTPISHTIEGRVGASEQDAIVMYDMMASACRQIVAAKAEQAERGGQPVN